jgi:murein DD-endopeptidase MepM/ murein hydrolase activator NlpD
VSRAGWFLVGGLFAGLASCAVAVPIALSVGSMINAPLKAAVVPASMSCGSTDTTRQAVLSTPKVAGWSAEQVRNAATIVQTGQDLKVPPRGWVIAVATSMQESTLHNYGDLGSRNDHDSLGLFQQRPSTGWGTPAQTRDPVHASTSFYQRLVKIKGWQTMTLTKAAQKVQRSAYPNAYAKHEDAAARLVNTITGGAAQTPITAAVAGRCATADQVTSSGWVRPVSAPIGSGFRTSDRPTHDGVDLMAKRGTPIRAAAAGTVVHMECDKTELGYHCDHDGSSGAWPGGCGWYVDIRHADKVVTRYCHMQSKPLVSAGDKVTAGQQIGIVGSTGHSSGPHLHFEVHLNGDRSSAGAINPIKFMKDHGAALGTGPQGGQKVT